MNQMHGGMSQQVLGNVGGVGAVGMPMGSGAVGGPGGMMPQQSPQQQQHQMQTMIPQQNPNLPHPQNPQQQQQQQQNQQGAQQQPQSQQQQLQTPQQQQQQQQQTDNISKVKSLMVPLRESLATTLKHSGQLLQCNNLTDNGIISKKGESNDQNPPPRFDKHLEQFYSICDQIELNLKTAIQCIQQNESTQHYLHVHVANTRHDQGNPNEMNPSVISYPQFLGAARTQIAYAKEVHDTLICAALNISNTNE